MNRRQRKKWRVGEFREYGFALRFQVPGPTTPLDADPFFDAFIEAVEGVGLAVTGGTGSTYDVVVMGLREARRSVMPEQRDALLGWLATRPEVSGVQAGPLTDLWYGSFEHIPPAA